MQITWTEPAASALEQIQDYIARDNRRAAWEVAQKIRHAVSQLADYPKLV
ncbi:MAG: type II toxin-antitoxin system RelE/ParE family toxin [Gammaproteobacteria bacterium]|nr:type II toxin-antitoxin system RelE/ParE family toxin [Gammaproteobacteria bacterium]